LELKDKDFVKNKIYTNSNNTEKDYIIKDFDKQIKSSLVNM
jgi:hypothetical protein